MNPGARDETGGIVWKRAQQQMQLASGRAGVPPASEGVFARRE